VGSAHIAEAILPHSTNNSVKKGSSMIQLIRKVCKQNKKAFLWVLCLNIAVGLMSSISIVMLVPMLDLLDVDLGKGSSFEVLLRPFLQLSYYQRAGVIIGIFVLLLLLRAFLNRMAVVEQNKLLEQYEMFLRSSLYDGMTMTSWEKLSGMKNADLINLFTVQCRQARVCLQWTIALIGSAVTAIMQLAIACWMSLPVTLTVIAVGCGFLALFRPVQKKSKSYGEKAIEVNRNLHREIQDQLSGIKEIRAYGVEKTHTQRFRSISQAYYDTSLKMTQLRVMPQLCYSAAAALMIAFAFIFSVLVLDTGTAQLMVLVYIFSRLWPVFSSWQGQLQNIHSYLPAAEKIEQALHEFDSTIQHETEHSEIIDFSRELTFDNVSFAYETGRDEVLHDVSFTLPFGSVTALVGRSGAGKSTTADLLLGLLYPKNGKITVDGTPLTAENMTSWHQMIGYVPQEPMLLNASVRENLLRFHPEATEENIAEALKQAQAWDFVDKLEQGLDTVIGDKGVRLSGGQRQRIVLARVLLGKPKLIILDEATSALDYESENAVRETIRTLKDRSTVLIIAHRLATIRGADYAIVLEDGRVAEQGSMQELLHKPDGYLNRMLSVE